MCMNVLHPLQVLTLIQICSYFPAITNHPFLLVTKSQKLCQETTTQVARTLKQFLRETICMTMNPQSILSILLVDKMLPV